MWGSETSGAGGTDGGYWGRTSGWDVHGGVVRRAGGAVGGGCEVWLSGGGARGDGADPVWAVCL